MKVMAVVLTPSNTALFLFVIISDNRLQKKNLSFKMTGNLCFCHKSLLRSKIIQAKERTRDEWRVRSVSGQTSKQSSSKANLRKTQRDRREENLQNKTPLEMLQTSFSCVQLTQLTTRRHCVPQSSMLVKQRVGAPQCGMERLSQALYLYPI